MPYLLLLSKVLILCIVAIATRGTLPRYRFDQFTQLNWKHFIFIWIGYLVFLTIFYLFFI
nr:NADH dehydrogenase subunit 1 [Ichthyophthirius multifiliis]